MRLGGGPACFPPIRTTVLTPELLPCLTCFVPPAAAATSHLSQLESNKGKEKDSPAQSLLPPSPPPQASQKESPAAFSSLTCFSPKAVSVSSLPSPGSALNQPQEPPLPTRPRPEFRIPLSPSLHLVTSLTHKEGVLRDVINACWERKQNPGLCAWQRQQKPCPPPPPFNFPKVKVLGFFFSSCFFPPSPLMGSPSAGRAQRRC